ncbi:MAG: hypothetical protein VB858_16725 [Planctomycetaceae bacterium]
MGIRLEGLPERVQQSPRAAAAIEDQNFPGNRPSPGKYVVTKVDGFPEVTPENQAG